MIDKLRHTHPVDKLCQLMDVAKSGYQAWSRGKVIPARRLEDARLVAAINAAHQRGRGILGRRRFRPSCRARASLSASTVSNDCVSLTASAVHTRRNFASRLIQSTCYQWRRICWIANSPQLPRIGCGSPTSSTFRPTRVGCFWPRSRIYTPAKLSAGRWIGK